MRVFFCRSRTITSWLIRAFTWSSWSHCAIDTGQGTIIEATWPRVREISLAAFQADNGIIESADFTVPDSDAAVRWGRLQIGDRYDLGALLGFVLHRNWEAPGKWFCSELATMALAAGGLRLFRESAQNRVTPQDLWMVAPR
jgi:uncharacterized protein YycO